MAGSSLIMRANQSSERDLQLQRITMDFSSERDDLELVPFSTRKHAAYDSKRYYL